MIRNFADRIKILYINKGYSQASFARAIGLSNQAISGWRKGSNPSIEILNKIATLLDTDIQSLMSDIRNIQDIMENARSQIAKALSLDEKLVILQIQITHPIN